MSAFASRIVEAALGCKAKLFQSFLELSEMIDIVSISSLIVAGVALWIAWDSRRKTTQHVFLPDRVSAGYADSIEHPAGYWYFEIYIKNLGLPFPRMSVSLRFHEPNVKGWMTHRLCSIDIVTDRSSDSASGVATGQVAKCGWRTYEMDQDSIQFLAALRDLKKQRAVLTVYSAGYIVGTIKPGSLSERTRVAWQRTVSKVCCWLKLGLYAADQDSWQARIRTPDSQTLSLALNLFLEALRKQGIPTIGPNATNIQWR